MICQSARHILTTARDTLLPLRPSLIVGVFMAGFTCASSAAPLLPGNVVATVREGITFFPHPSFVAEFTPTGVRRQKIADVPTPGGTAVPTREEVRGLAYGADGTIHVYNGSFDPYLGQLDPVTRTWSQSTFAGWSTTKSWGHGGGIDATDRYLYATDQNNGAAIAPAGIVRFDLHGGPTIRFAESITSPTDVYVGPDRMLYVLENSPFGIHVIDPVTLAITGQIPYPANSPTTIAVWNDGSVFGASFNTINRFSASGTLLDSLVIDTSGNITDIDIDADGRIVLGTLASGELIFTDIDLDQYTKFKVIQETQNAVGGDIRVSWVEDPTPMLSGDTDGDGDVDDTDLGTAISNYTGPVGPVGFKTIADGDTDLDADVDDTDLGAMIASFTGPLVATVPEPASLGLLGVGALLATSRRRSPFVTGT